MKEEYAMETFFESAASFSDAEDKKKEPVDPALSKEEKN